MEIFEILQQYGPLAGVVVWFLWRDGKREDKLTVRIEKLEDEQRQVILPLVEKATTVITENTIVLQEYMRRCEVGIDKFEK